MSEVAASVTLCLDSVEVVSVMISLEFVVTKDLFSSGLVVTSLVDGLMTSIAFSSMLFYFVKFKVYFLFHDNAPFIKLNNSSKDMVNS